MTYFYPRPPRGGRPAQQHRPPRLPRFLPTPSARRATRTTPCICLQNVLFLPTPSARRATALVVETAVGGGISTHALREEGDAQTPSGAHTWPDFYPRPPRGGRRFWSGTQPRNRSISTHALREEGDAVVQLVGGQVGIISTHALREEGDASSRSSEQRLQYFYPRPPRGGRPYRATPQRTNCNFYPRPPRGGRHHQFNTSATLLQDFYPRPPRGGRLQYAVLLDRARQFLPTPSARRATCGRELQICNPFNFYPRPPRGGRPCCRSG